MKATMTIVTHFGGDPKYYAFTKDVETLGDLKEAFLKRFGNRNDESNKLLRQKQLVKQLTYDAKTLDEWLTSVNQKTDWELRVVLA